MITYFLVTNCYGFLFYGMYHLLLKGRRSHTWNRIYFLAISPLVLLLPLIRLNITSLPDADVAHTLKTFMLPEVILKPDSTMVNVPWYADFSPGSVIYIAYTCIASILLLRLAYRFTYLWLFLRKQKFISNEGYRLALDTGIGPASFGSTILLPSSEIDNNILTHEKAHMYYRHHYDKLFMELLKCFFFPVIPLWLIYKELAMIHEFQADAFACTNKQNYARILLSEHLNIPKHYLLQSFFHHPLKRRIQMLHRNDATKGNRLAKTIVLISSVMLISTIIYAQSMQQKRKQKTQAPAEQTVAATLNAPSDQAAPIASNTAPVSSLAQENEQPAQEHLYEDNAEIQQEKAAAATQEKIYVSVDDMPEPSVDVMKFLAENIQYPSEARKDSIEGRTITRFVISEEGKIRDIVIQRSLGAAFDKEVLRVLNMMPDWKPGEIEGKPVSIYYTLPITFKLR